MRGQTFLQPKEDSLPALTDPLPIISPPDLRNQILRVSLRNNPATSIPSSEIKRLFSLRRNYREQVQSSEMRHEIAVFEAKESGKPIPPCPPEIPIPDGLNFDIIRANEPSSAVRMYCPAIRHTSTDKRSKSVTAKRPDLKQYCPACNPREEDLPHPLPTKRRNGTSHWQVLDEPFLPALPPTYFSKTRKPQAFYLPSRKGPKNGIPVVVDDLLELREHEDHAYLRDLAKRIERENNQEKKRIGDRRKAIRTSTKKRQQEVMELENKSGQLKAQSQLASRHSMLKVKKLEVMGPTMEEMEALRELENFDEQLWNQAQALKKVDTVPVFE
jgi:hypothetical protein